MEKSDPTFLKLAIRDPVLFISRYSGLRLKEFQCEILYLIEEADRTIILLPATHGKSTLISLWYVVYKIAQNRNVRIILLMKNDDEVGTYARSLRAVLSGNHQLILDWGRFAPQGRDSVWNNNAIVVAGRQIMDPQPTVLFASANTIDQALGRRCDIFIADDIVTPTTCATQAQRDKQWDIFNSGIETSPQYIWDRDPETGKLLVPVGIDWPQDIKYEKGIVSGTVFHPDDLYHRKVGRIGEMPHGKVIKGRDKSYRAIKFDCWLDEDKTQPLWPERWSKEKLRAKEQSVGRLDFDQRFRNRAVDEGSMVFKKHWIYGEVSGGIEYPGCLNRTRARGEYDEKELNLIVLGVDPSTGRKNRGSSYTAAVVLGVNTKVSPMKRYLIDVYRAQMGFDDIISLITFGDENMGIPGMYELYKYTQGRVEANAAQTYLLDNARMKEAGLRGVRVLPHETQHYNKIDPIIGVASMQAMFKDGLIDIPYYNAPSTREPIDEFINDLLIFPEGTNDYPMALWFAELAVRKAGSEYRCTNAGPGQVFQNPRFK